MSGFSVIAAAITIVPAALLGATIVVGIKIFRGRPRRLRTKIWPVGLLGGACLLAWAWALWSFKVQDVLASEPVWIADGVYQVVGYAGLAVWGISAVGYIAHLPRSKY